MARIIVHITCKTLPSFGLDQKLAADAVVLAWSNHTRSLH